MNWTEEQYEEYITKRKSEAISKLNNHNDNPTMPEIILPQKRNSELSTVVSSKPTPHIPNNPNKEQINFVAEFVVPLPPVTKKNHGQIVSVGKKCPHCGKGSTTIMLPSKPYQAYETAIRKYLCELHRIVGTIDYPINLKCVFYTKTRRQSDLVGHLQAIQDLMTHYKVIEDDCRDIVATTDGSMVLYDKENPRTEITITKLADYEQWGNASKAKKKAK